MNDYMKTLLSKFFLCSVILMCLTMVAVGFVTVTEKSQQMINGDDYAVVVLSSINEKLELNVNEKSFDLSFFEQYEQEISKYLKVTPISSLTYFFEVIFDFFE